MFGVQGCASVVVITYLDQNTPSLRCYLVTDLFDVAFTITTPGPGIPNTTSYIFFALQLVVVHVLFEDSQSVTTHTCGGGCVRIG